MGRLLIGRTAQHASVSILCAEFRLSLVADQVAGGVEPLGALLALNNQLAFIVRRGTRRALAHGGARSAERAVRLVSPTGVDARLVGPAYLADGAPFALPIALRNVVQRWLHAINVVGNVTLVAQQQTGLVVSFATALANRTVKTMDGWLH